MDAPFWHERWQNKETAFHLDRVNPLLVKHFDQLALQAGDQIFVPLCGASHDLPWLAAQGLDVIGVELSELAVAQLFDEHGLTPSRTEDGELTVWQAGAIRVYQGDLFALTMQHTGSVAAIYDRASLVALPAPMRLKYIDHLNAITPKSRRSLLITFEYDPAVMNGPPFPVDQAAVDSYFSVDFAVQQLSNADIIDKSPHFRDKGHEWIREPVYLMTPQ